MGNMKTTLYRYFDDDGNLLYLGITGDNTNRQSQHRRDSFWFGEISTASFDHFDSREEALAAEKVAIQTEKPLHNKQHATGIYNNFDMAEAVAKHHFLTLLNGEDPYGNPVMPDESHSDFIALARSWILDSDELGRTYDERLAWELFVVQIELELRKVDFMCYKTCQQCKALVESNWYLENLESAKAKLRAAREVMQNAAN